MFKASAYGKQGRVKIARLVTKFRGYSIDVWKIAIIPFFRNTVVSFFYNGMGFTNYN